MKAEAIWIKVQARLKAFVLARVRDEANTDDVLQEIYLKMHQNLHQLRHEEKAEYWLFRIAQNAVNDYFRQRRSLSLQTPAPEAPLTEEEKQVQELTEEVSQWLPFMLELLPDKYRLALYLTEIEGLSQRELAERLELSYSGAKSRVQRGREKLKDIVLQCCEVATDSYGNVLGYQPREAAPVESVGSEEEECC